MKSSQNNLHVPSTDEEGGNKWEAALVGSLAPGLAPCASWAAVSRRSGHAAPGKARQPRLGISGLLSVLVKSLPFECVHILCDNRLQVRAVEMAPDGYGMILASHAAARTSHLF